MKFKLPTSIILGAALAAAGFSPSVQAADEIIFGDIHPITGGAVYYGLPESRAIQLAAEEINKAGGVKVGGKPYTIRVMTEDDQANPSVGVAALRKLLASDVRFVIGPLASGVAPALKPIIEKNDKVTQLIDGATADGITNGRNVFRNQGTIAAFDVAVLDLTKAKQFPSIAVITDRFHSGFMSTQKSLVNQLGALKANVLAEEYFKLGDTDFSAQATKIKSLNPAAVLLRGFPAESALITKQLQQLGYKGQIIWEAISPPSTVVKNIPAAQMEGIYNGAPATTEHYVRAQDPKAMKLDAAYRAKYGEPAGELTALSYDAVYILRAAIERAGSTSNDAVNKAMTELKVADIPQLVMHYTPQPDGRLFDKDGQADVRGVVSVWQGDGWRPAGKL